MWLNRGTVVCFAAGVGGYWSWHLFERAGHRDRAVATAQCSNTNCHQWVCVYLHVRPCTSASGILPPEHIREPAGSPALTFAPPDTPGEKCLGPGEGAVAPAWAAVLSADFVGLWAAISFDHKRSSSGHFGKSLLPRRLKGRVSTMTTMNSTQNTDIDMEFHHIHAYGACTCSLTFENLPEVTTLNLTNVAVDSLCPLAEYKQLEVWVDPR